MTDEELEDTSGMFGRLSDAPWNRLYVWKYAAFRELSKPDKLKLAVGRYLVRRSKKGRITRVAIYSDGSWGTLS